MDVNTLNLSITSRIYLPSIGPLLLLADLDQGDSVKKQLEMKLQGICFYTSCRLHPFGLFLSANTPLPLDLQPLNTSSLYFLNS